MSLAFPKRPAKGVVTTDAQDGEAFTLKPSPSWTKRGTINADKQRQTMLLSGLDCCPGQESLFQTDGEG